MYLWRLFHLTNRYINDDLRTSITKFCIGCLSSSYYTEYLITKTMKLKVTLFEAKTCEKTYINFIQVLQIELNITSKALMKKKDIEKSSLLTACITHTVTLNFFSIISNWNSKCFSNVYWYMHMLYK